MLAESPAQNPQSNRPQPGDIVDCVMCRGSGKLMLAHEHDCPRCSGTGKTTIAQIKCPVCSGSGRPMGSIDTCRTCHGSGWINKLM